MIDYHVAQSFHSDEGFVDRLVACICAIRNVRSSLSFEPHCKHCRFVYHRYCEILYLTVTVPVLLAALKCSKAAKAAL